MQYVDSEDMSPLRVYIYRYVKLGDTSTVKRMEFHKELYKIMVFTGQNQN